MSQAAVIAPSRNWDEILAGRTGLPYAILFFLLIYGKVRPDVYFESHFLDYLGVYLLGVLFLFWLATPQKKLDNPQLRYILLFGVLMAVAVPLARNAGLAVAAIKSFSVYIIIGSVVKIQFIDTFSKWERFLRWSVALSGLVAVLGVLSGGRVEGIPSLGDENDFCLYINSMIPLAFFLGQASRSMSRKLLYYGCLALFVLAVLMTFSRGGFVGLMAAGMFMVMKNPRRLAGFFLIGILALSVLITAPREYWHEMETIRTENIETGTGKNRIEYWKAGLKMFKDHPVIGVGPRNFGVWLPDYHAIAPHKSWGRVAHSLYIDVLAETGLVGMLLFLGLLWHCFKDYRYIALLNARKSDLLEKAAVEGEEKERISESIRMLHFMALGTFGSLIAFLVTGIFISVLFYGYLWGIAVSMIITVNLTRKMEGALAPAKAEAAEAR